MGTPFNLAIIPRNIKISSSSFLITLTCELCSCEWSILSPPVHPFQKFLKSMTLSVSECQNQTLFRAMKLPTPPVHTWGTWVIIVIRGDGYIPHGWLLQGVTWSMEVAVRLLWNRSSEIMSFSSWLSISTSTLSSFLLLSQSSQQQHLVMFVAELLRLVEGLGVGVEAVAGVTEWHLSKYSY